MVPPDGAWVCVSLWPDLDRARCVVLSHFSGILPLSSELQAQGCPSAHKSTFSTGPHKDGMTQRFPHRWTSQEESWVSSLGFSTASAPTSLIEQWCGPSEALVFAFGRESFWETLHPRLPARHASVSAQLHFTSKFWKPVTCTRETQVHPISSPYIFGQVAPLPAFKSCLLRAPLDAIVVLIC